MEKANEEGQGLIKKGCTIDHSSSDCTALTGLPTAWEGDSIALTATRELDEDAAKHGGSQNRSPARSSQTLEEDTKNDNEDAANRGGGQKQLPAIISH